MTRSVYIIGAAGSGKSTLTEHLIDTQLGWSLGEPETLHRSLVATHRVRFRGQRLYDAGEDEIGVYFGVRRAEFPGTDACDKVCGPVAREWLRETELPPVLIGEGLRFTTRPFLTALSEVSDLTIVHLVASEEELERRTLGRGSVHSDTFVTSTATRARNIAKFMDDKAAVETFRTDELGPEGISPLLDFYLTS